MFMKILIVSDSHGDNSKLDRLLEKHKDMDYYLHAGDSLSSNAELYPFLSVRGNCDYSIDLDDKLILHTPYGKLLMKHVKNLTSFDLSQNDIKIFVFGHTHVREFGKVNDIYYINPGSISLPRDGRGLCYAIIEINKDDVKIQFLNI